MECRVRIARTLQSSGYSIELASDEKRALTLVAEGNFQLAVVMCGPSNTSLATMLQLRDAVPKMMVVVKEMDEITPLRRSVPDVEVILLENSNEGAFLARVGEIMCFADRTTDEPTPAPSVLSVDECKLDLAGHVFVDANGREVALTRAEVELVKELARSPRQVLSRDSLRHAVAGRGADPFERSIDMLVARLRRKIEPYPKVPRILVTVPGVGYKLMVRPQSGGGKPPTTGPTGSERRQVTALCCKLAGALEHAVNFDPEDQSSITGSFQNACITTVTRIGGTIAAVMPEEILAYFGYPKAHEDDAERAVNAALDAVAKIAQLMSPTGEPLQARAAVATGLVIAYDLQAIGGPSVIAAELCDLAAPNSVLVTTATRRLLNDVFVCENPGRFILSGISQAIDACRVSGTRPVKSRFKAKHSNKIVRLVGRDQQLQQLLALWDRAQRGKGQVGLLCGEAGIGKSHLCEFFLEHTRGGPDAILRFQCSPRHINSPFFPVISHLEHKLGFEQSDTPGVKFEKLQASLSQALNACQDEVSLYAALLSIATPHSVPSPNYTPQRQKDLLIATLIRHLLYLADKQPLVITLADAHWVDSSTLELVNGIIPLVKTARILFLIKFRPEFVPQWVGETHVTMLRLDRMRRNECLAIISGITKNKRLPRDVEQQIIDKSDGIPLFIEELTRAVLESEFVKDVGSRQVAGGPLPSVAVPATLLDSLTARLDRLGSAKEIVQVGATIGREFTHAVLAAVASVSKKSLDAAIAQLAASDLIFVNRELPGPTYTFKHALVRDAAYATLSRVTRQQLHQRIADTLEKNSPLTVENQPELLADHLVQAGSNARAADYLIKAGQRAIEHSANTEATQHLTRARELLQASPHSPKSNRAGFQLEVLLGQAMLATYGYAAPKTRETLLRAKTLVDNATDPSQKFAVLYGIWASHYVAGEIAKQRAAADEFLAEAEHANDAAISSIAHRIVGTTFVTMGEFTAGSDHLKQAWALYDLKHHAGHRHQYGQDIGASTLCYLSWALWHLGHVDQASQAATRAMRLAERLSHPHTLAYTICHARGFMDLFRHHYEDTECYAGLFLSVCKENGFSHWENCAVIFKGWALVHRGQVDQGAEMLREGLVAWQRGGARLWLPTFLSMEAEVYAKAGRDEAALQAIEQALAICESGGERWAMAEVLRTKARLLSSIVRVDSKDIESILLKSLEIAQRQRARSLELRTACDLSRLWQREGQSSKALELLRSVYDQFTDGFDTADLRDAWVLMRNLKRNTRSKRTDGRKAVMRTHRRPDAVA
jgi:predicted ATPase/class 3 adenylate cyclase/DNA-binding response OmpR family regulator